MKKTMTKKLFTFILFVSGMFSFSPADAQFCVCFCNGQPKNNAECYTKANGTQGCRHISQHECLGGRSANEQADVELFTLDVSLNPVSGSSDIYFFLEQSEKVSMNIFDVNGRLVTTLADDSLEEGDHEITWNAADVNAGIYFLRFETVDYAENQKLIVTK